MEYKDIYSKYPELSSRLIRTSKKLNEVSLVGNCNLDLSLHEIKNIVDIKPYAKKAIFDIYNKREQGLVVGVSCFMKMITKDDTYHRWIYDTYISMSEEYGYSHKLNIYINDDLRTELFDILYDIEFMGGINIKTFDVKSLYLLYSQRKSCLIIPNYAKIKTLEIFKMIIDKFDDHNTIVVLNLYVMINCLILDLDMSEKFIKAQNDFSLLGENEYDYDDYIEDTIDREILIKEIIITIQNF